MDEEEKTKLVGQDSLEKIHLVGMEQSIANAEVKQSEDNITTISIGSPTEPTPPSGDAKDETDAANDEGTISPSTERRGSEYDNVPANNVTNISVQQEVTTTDSSPPRESTTIEIKVTNQNDVVTSDGVEMVENQIPHESSQGPLDICIFLPSGNGEGVLLKVEDGENAQSEELLAMLIEELNLPPLASEVFSLWMVSPLLALQCKPKHVPHKLYSQWQGLVAKYTDENEDTIAREEPIIRLQRNVYYPRSKEIQIEDESILKLLYEESVFNVVNERYPCDDYDALAGYQSILSLGVYSVLVHTDDRYRQDDCAMKNFYPSHLCKRNLFKSSNKRLQLQHQTMSNKIGLDSTKKGVYKKYLQVCWNMPYYGSAFFYGQIEKPKGSFPFRLSSEKDVMVAINRDGAFVIDTDKFTLLLGIEYENLRWAYKVLDKGESSKELLLLQFVDNKDNQTIFKMLKVVSKQARLMDALIQSCVDLLCNDDYKPATPTENKEPMFEKMKAGDGSCVISNKLDKLCLSTYSESGECLDATS